MKRSSADWSKDAWSWRPGEGRWSMRRHGLPKAAVYARLDTRDHRPHERYDFWREAALYEIDADRRSDPSPFLAEGAGVIGPGGSIFTTRSHALAGGRRLGQSERDGGNDIAIGLVLSGKRRHAEGDERSLAAAGQFFAFDARCESRVAWTAFESVHLAMRRERAEAILGPRLPSSAALARWLGASPAGRILAAQMRALAGEIDNLHPDERGSLLEITLDLADLALRDVAGRAWGDDMDVIGSVFAAAMRLIDVNLANPDLDPDMLAGLLGCSRATLYRCFAEQDIAIAEAIRTRRLARAREFLADAPRSVPIADIAMRCGYLDPAHFSRLFRREYGISPTDARG
ncbi:helix-turn-helix domain-containing protein [Labrys sp. KNU-23]|uniref:helix-turn-helix domain-containing protein n=1 Tax=Labrys sp. KNU-23 TaxID=2789216 RepID=UPI0011EFFF57|nr:helix-turn-helix domain-containing protein [Labrys sp. KNU-23]QEN89293.1 helix-turn-helix domain-containing protein [Labrys sp. KNU-23]